jgi:membrane associated rhomboid family serine protease
MTRYMASGPDLFVVCKSCGSEVSPYITECPYCGTRLRKRAPKLDRGGVPKAPKRSRVRPSLGRLRPNEIPGIKADRRPYGTILIVVASLIATLVVRIHPAFLVHLWFFPDSDKELWRSLTALFVYLETGYQVVTLAAVFLFGWLLERRHGAWATLLTFLLGGAGGLLCAHFAGETAILSGANGGALALLGAWAMRDVLGRRHGREDDSDLLGTLVIAIVLILVPLVVDEASAVAGVAGGLIGVVLGLGFARLRER